MARYTIATLVAVLFFGLFLVSLAWLNGGIPN
jgi:hypothetical protein